MEDYEFGHMDRPTWMWWIACGGGLVGMATALALAWITEMSWPINVGGLPIVGLVAEPDHHVRADDARGDHRDGDHAGRHRGPWPRRRRLYDPQVSDGKILVGVENPPAAAVGNLQKELGAPPGAEVRTT